MKDQEKLWDEIAPEWHEYKKIPAEKTRDFLENTSGNVLDLGSGSGRNMIQIKNGKMFLVDFSQEMLNLAEDKAGKEGIDIETKQGQLFDIPYEDNFFDYAICISALHCIEGEENRKKSVEELYRVLKKGGKAYVGVWNVASKRFKHKRNKGKEQMIGWTDKGERYYYLFSEEEVHKLFESVGFKIVLTHNSEMMVNFVVEKV